MPKTPKMCCRALDLKPISHAQNKVSQKRIVKIIIEFAVLQTGALLIMAIRLSEGLRMGDHMSCSLNS